MEQTKTWKMRLLPWLLIAIGIYTLDMFQGYVALACMVIGVTMIIESIWPEKWGNKE